MLTSRHESRKHGVIDGRVTKKSGGLGYSKNRSPVRTAKDALLMPSYISDSKLVSVSPETVRDAKPQVPAKPKDKPQMTPAPPPERYNELSPLMTKMVEDELKNIMIKVWQTLPDDMPDDVEKMVVDKFKGAAGDDLRNTIGLNVTKRLLNVHNGILVKVVIFPAVTPSEIQEFAKKHLVSELKHVQRWTYAGRMASWTELDELYAKKNLKCGSSRVTVSPVYSFLKCPSTLRTIFDGNQNYTKAKKIEMEIARRTKKLEGRVIVTADKVLAEEAKKEMARKDKAPDTKEAKTEAKQTELTSKVSTEAQNVAVLKNTVDKPTNKQASSTNIVRKETQNKTEVQSKTPEANATNDKKQMKTELQTNKVEPAKTVANKPLVSTNVIKQNTVPKNATKAETDKTVANKPASNAHRKDTVPTKTDANKVETTKSIANKPSATSPDETKVETAKTVANKPSVATNTPNKSTASPKPNATKVGTNKAVANKPSITTNTNTASPKPSTPKVEAKAVANKPSVSTNTNKKDIVSPKTNEKKPGTAVKEPIKTPIKEPAKLITNKPVSANSAKTSEVKKPAAKSAKVETPTKIQTKTVANKRIETPKKETVKSKPIENRKADTKVAPKASKPSVNSINSKNNAENDFDELDDHDILALLSGGIVLDECSGSDED